MEHHTLIVYRYTRLGMLYVQNTTAGQCHASGGWRHFGQLRHSADGCTRGCGCIHGHSRLPVTTPTWVEVCCVSHFGARMVSTAALYTMLSLKCDGQHIAICPPSMYVLKRSLRAFYLMIPLSVGKVDARSYAWHSDTAMPCISGIII